MFACKERRARVSRSSVGQVVLSSRCFALRGLFTGRIAKTRAKSPVPAPPLAPTPFVSRNPRMIVFVDHRPDAERLHLTRLVCGPPHPARIRRRNRHRVSPLPTPPRPQPMLFSMCAAGSFQRLAADDGRNRCNCDRAVVPQRFANAGNCDDRPDADERVRRAQDDGLRVHDRLEHPRRRLGLLWAPSKRTPATRSRARRFTKYVWNSNSPDAVQMRVRTRSFDIGTIVGSDALAHRAIAVATSARRRALPQALCSI